MNKRIYNHAQLQYNADDLLTFLIKKYLQKSFQSFHQKKKKNLSPKTNFRKRHDDSSKADKVP